MPSTKGKFVRSIQKANGIKLNDNNINDPYSDPIKNKAIVPSISLNFNQTPNASGRINGGNDSTLSGAKSVKKSSNDQIFGQN